MNDLIASSTWRTVSMDAPKPKATWIAARVMALLSHYYQPDIPEGVDELAMADWIAVLGDLPQIAVSDAVMEWLRNETRRPKPADIRQRALARIEPKAPPVPDDDDWPFKPNVTGPEELQRRREFAARMAETYSALKRVPKVEDNA